MSNSNVMQRRTPQIRAQALRNLEMLIERYPNLRVGQILSNAIDGRDLFNLEDDDLGYHLNHLFVTYTQLEAAGIGPRKKL
jgi:hypothetical protein